MHREGLITVCDHLAELQYRRKYYIKLVNKQTNAAKAMVRRALGFQWDQDEDSRAALNKRAAAVVSKALSGKAQSAADAGLADVVAADLDKTREGVAPLIAARAEIERQMRKVAKTLPVWRGWGAGVHGFGELGLAVIIGEGGDIFGRKADLGPGTFSSVGRFWKRMGLAPLSKGDISSAASSWRLRGGLTGEEWESAGYKPSRLAEMVSVIGDPLLRAQSERTDDDTGEVLKESGPYRLIYDEHKAKLEAKNAAGGFADTAARIAEAARKKGMKPAKENIDGRLTPKHIDNMARRYMLKRVLRDFQVAWQASISQDAGDEPVRAATEGAEPIREAPPATLSADEADAEGHPPPGTRNQGALGESLSPDEGERSAELDAKPNSRSPSAPLPATAGERQAVVDSKPRAGAPAAQQHAGAASL